jgi:hypothetical protein
MKIAIMTSLFAEWDMEVEVGHFLEKVSQRLTVGGQQFFFDCRLLTAD